jgi:group I intron endonuclease
MNTYSIYRATNRANGKVYIGFSKDWKQRKRRHKSIYKTTQNKFYDAIKKYGWESFDWEEIYTSLDKDHCYLVMEQYFIEQYNSIENGYNIIQGGTGTLGAVANKIWVNDGTKHKRVSLDCIPEGWVVGRINLKRSVGMSDESKALIGLKNKEHGVISKLNRTSVVCPYCNKSSNYGTMMRWHFDRCKFKTS